MGATTTTRHDEARPPVVGALFDDRRAADAAAFAVRQRCAGEVEVVRPQDRRSGRLLRDAWRRHGWYLPAGIGAGLLATLARVSFGGPGDVNDPWPLAIFLGGLGLFVAAVLALLMTARPSWLHRRPGAADGEAGAGHWAVVARPERAADARTAQAMLVAEGGELQPDGRGD